MAGSNSHKWGQVIGGLFELAVNDLLTTVATKHGLYLDKQGLRKARRGKYVRWKDRYGNHHNLDYVLERGGTEDATGTPVAFIETAWRRYTKHSKNKAQEIEGALVPLSVTYAEVHPLLGCMLAGDFTTPALSQLKSRGFQVLYFPSADIFRAIKIAGVNATFDQDTSEEDFEEKLNAFSRLSISQVARVKRELMKIDPDQVAAFVDSIHEVLSRTIVSIAITALYGQTVSVDTIESAIVCLRGHKHLAAPPGALLKYELTVKYSNGDNIHGMFNDEINAIGFLESFL